MQKHTFPKEPHAQEKLELTCAVHVVSGQLKQPHVLVGDGIKGAAGQQNKRDTAASHLDLFLVKSRKQMKSHYH